MKPPVFIEWMNDDGEPSTWFVEADDAQYDVLLEWMADNHPRTIDDGYIGRVASMSFDDFKTEVMDEE
jgi:hypothetical protein